MTTTLRNNAWLIWFIAALFYGVEFFQRVAPSVISQDIVATFHITETSLGFIISLYYYAYAVAQIPVGLTLDRFGARTPLAIAAFAVSLGTLLFAHTDNLIILSLARIIVGIGSAFAFVGCLKLAKDWFTGRQFAFIVGLTNTIGVLGALFGETPLNSLVHRIGWQLSLLFTAIAGFIVCALILVFVRNAPNEQIKMVPLPIKTTLLQIIKSSQSWLIGLYAGLMVAPVIAYAELWSNAFLEIVHHINSTEATFATTLIFVGIAVGGPTNGFLSSILNRRKLILLIGNVMALALLTTIILVPQLSFLALCIALFFFGFFTSSMLVAFPLNTEQHPSTISATVIAFTNMLIMIIGALFQPTIGYLLDFLSAGSHHHLLTSAEFRQALWCLPIALAINLIILCFIRESHCKNLCK